MDRAIRIMLVEDHPEYREIIAMALARESDMNLIWQFGTSEHALRSLEERQERYAPDIILLDLNLPGIDGLDSIQFFRDIAPEAGIIILTQSDREADVLKAIMLGANGYLLKSSTVSQITEGIREVMQGGASIDAGVANFILKTLKSKLPDVSPEAVLTKREIEVLELLSEGHSKKIIADQLGIGMTTVVTHVSHIYEKLKVSNAPEAVAKAFREGILSIG
tara:strand:+ start:513 stop:1175 length:663 start_codon:yes stop_codon:yes gene_type:complete